MSDCSSDNSAKLRRSPEAERAKKRQRTEPPSFFDPTALVTFVIGKDDEETKFLIHKSTACEYPPVLRAAFNSAFIEGQTQTYRLEDTTGRAFKHVMRWIYSQRVVAQQLQDDFEGDDDSSSGIEEDASLVEAWVLTDKLGLITFQNEILKTIHAIAEPRRVIPTSSMKYVYQNTSPDSPLRRFSVAICGLDLLPDSIVEEIHVFPAEFLVDVFTFLARLRDGVKDPANDRREKIVMADFMIQEEE